MSKKFPKKGMGCWKGKVVNFLHAMSAAHWGPHDGRDLKEVVDFLWPSG